jgi:hypothetical protein
MTDQTTTPPASNKEAAHELEDMLGHLGGDAGPTSVRVSMGRDTTYWLHTRTLRLAVSALRDRQNRIDAVNDTLAAQGPTALSTEQVKRISRLTADLADTETGVTLDLFTRGLQPTALAAVLRAGLTSVVGSSTADTVDRADDVPYAQNAEPGLALTSFAAHLESFGRFPYAAILPAKDSATWENGGPDVPLPAWISARALALILREAAAPIEPAKHDAPPAPERHEYSTEVRQAASDVLELDDEHDVKVRLVVNAVLDIASEHVRDVLKRPRTTPLVVMNQPKEVRAEDVQDLLGRFRGVIADAAADELRILARLDDVRP